MGDVMNSTLMHINDLPRPNSTPLGVQSDPSLLLLLKASAISTPEEICRPPYVTLAGIKFDLVLWRK